jgi:hypothetical protein
VNSTGYGPDGQIIEQVIDNGDGTGTRTDYTTTPPTVTQLSGLPLPDPKQTKRDQLVAWHQAELDTLLGAGNGSIADLSSQIDTLAAVANRTVAQNARLDNLRDARTDARRWVRTAKLVLLVDGDVPEALHASARLAAANCPEYAIKIIED